MVNALYRTAYRCAYQLMRIYWRVRHPLTRGALVAIWCNGRILTVRNSYVRYHSLPGGYVHQDEDFIDAAVRELREEVGLRVEPSQLSLALDVTHDWEGKRDHVQIFELALEQPPPIVIDDREIVACELLPPEEALKQELFPPLETHIRNKLREATA